MTGAASSGYRFIDTVPGELLDGQPIGPGEYVTLSKEDLKDPHIAAMLEDGKLIPGEEQAESKSETGGKK